MSEVKKKSRARSQAKPSTKITISLPDELLEWCDVMAAGMHLERNDIIRQSIAMGLIFMQAERLSLTERGKQYVDDWIRSHGVDPQTAGAEYSEQVGGVDGFVERMRAAREADAAEAAKRG